MSTTIVLVVAAVFVFVAATVWVVHHQIDGTQFIHKNGAILRVEGRPVISRCMEMFSEDPRYPTILVALGRAGFEARYVSEGRS